MRSVGLPLGWRRRREARELGAWMLLGFVSLLVLYPTAMIVLGSLQVSGHGEPAKYGWDAWRSAFSDAGLLSAAWNTLTLTLARQATSFPIAVVIAWIIARTDIPGSQWLEFLFWIAFFLPALPVTLGWIMLLDPEYGLLNTWLSSLPFVERGPFNIYSFWGLVWANLANTIAFKVILLTPAFRNMDARLEEASRVSGATTTGTLLRVVVPVMTPTLTVVLLLSTIASVQEFERELILGFPIRFFVYSTHMYLLVQHEPPLFAAASVLSSMILGLIVPLIALQRWAAGRRLYTTVSGQFTGYKTRLHGWRLPAFFFVLGAGLITTAVPLILLILASFMKLFGYFSLPDPLTIEHWSRVASDPLLLSSLWNTLLLASGTAVCVVVLSTMIAYVVVRTRFAGRAALDFSSWLPASLPGIMLGLGLLAVILATPMFRPLYGTMLIIILAVTIVTMTPAVQIIKGSFAQVGSDIEEAARVAGGTWFDSFRRVLVPIITPTLLLVGALTFIAAASNVGTIILLTTTETRPLAVLQLDYMWQGQYERGAVVGVMVVGLTTGISVIARIFGFRVGIRP